MASEEKRGRKASAKTADKDSSAGSTRKTATTSSANAVKRKSADSSAATARSKSAGSSKTPGIKKARSVSRKKVPAKKPPGSLVSIRGTVSSETRREMIAVAAFLRAEQRQFQDGDPVEDWLIAEKEVDRLLEGN